MQGYLYYSLLSDLGQAQIRLQISGSAQPGLKTAFTKGVNVDIPADLREQSMIVRVLSTVDRAIEETEALIAKQQRIKTGLMQDLLTRGIDEHGNLRSEQFHGVQGLRARAGSGGVGSDAIRFLRPVVQRRDSLQGPSGDSGAEGFRGSARKT